MKLEKMKDDLALLYNLSIESIKKNSDKTWIISTKNQDYLLKKHDSNQLENIYIRLNLIHENEFLLPLLSLKNHYLEKINNEYYSLSEYFSDEDLLAKDIRISFFIKSIGRLHQSSSYPIKASDGFLKETIEFLDNQISLAKQEIFSRVERIEHEVYHSPADWYFLMNYSFIYNAIKEADRNVSLLEESWNNSKNIHLSLTYQNFSYDHILVKQEKIISLDKMSLAPSIYDLLSLFNSIYDDKMDLSFIIDEYLNIHQLEKYEIHWLLAYLFIPKINRSENNLVDIENTFKTLSLIKMSEEISTKLSSLE